MTDEKIIELLNARDERALAAIEEKYSGLLRYAASNLLASREDVEECINDVLLSVWEHIPPEVPESLPAYLTVLMRNAAKRRTRDASAWKRGGQINTARAEFLEILDDGRELSSYYESRRAGEVINAFLRKLSRDDRRIFVMRFWFDMSYRQICEHTRFSETKVKSSLNRTRKKLAAELAREGITV